MNEQNYKVLTNIIGAVESGGQIYGNRRYDAYAPPYHSTPNEHTCTLGWAQNYAGEAKKLIKMIFDKNQAAFRKLDTASPSIESMLNKDWLSIRWNPNSSQKSALIKIISSDVGKECQDELFISLMKTFVAECEATYTKDVPAVMMYCEIRHLGGKNPTDRIFKRCNGDYSLTSIRASLKKDQNDTSNSNQVGDKKFDSRHDKCVEFIKKYAVSETGSQQQTTSNNDGGKTMAFKKYNLTESQVKQIARLCVQEQGGSEAGTKAEASLMANLLETSASRQKKYGSDGNGLYNFVRNGGWFYKAAHFMDNGSASATQIAWVRDVLVNGNRTLPKYIDEHDCFSDIASISTGSIRNRSDYVKNKTIIKNKMGSTYTFYCFPTSTSDPFGYTSAAYNKVMSEGGSSEPSSNEKTLNETTKYTGYVTADALNVRKWAGKENALCSFSPLYFQTAVAVCDEVKASDGSQWLYIKSNGKYGFVSAKYISKTRPDFIQEDTAGSGTPQEKVVAIAENEIGYLEKKSNSNLDSKTGNAGSNNYTKYARDVAPDVQGMAWCATFCMWVFTKAFGKDMAKKMCGGLSPDCDEVAYNYKRIGQFYKTPKVGDQILFIKNGNDYYHTGIVYKVTSATVYTIEGNTSSGSEVIPNGGAVCKKSYAIGNSKIGGYGRPKYDLVSSNQTPVTAPATVVTPKPEPTPAPTQKQPESKLNETVKWTGYINVDSSPVRTWAGKENSKVSFSPLKKGTAVGVCDELKSKAGNKWYYIMYNGKHGFVYAKYVSKEKPSAGWTGYVRTTSLNVRTKAGKTNPQTTFSPLKKGAEVTVMGETKSSAGNKWYYISYNGKTGYCLASCITDKKPASKTAKTAADITVSEFLSSCKNVMDTARIKKYRYGDSHAADPTTDKVISCDRLIAKALYDLGFKDQRIGGETCGTLDAWLKAHGFKRSTKASDIKKGSIVLVKHPGQSYIGHAFVAVSYNASTWSSKRYDAGSNERIQSVQPITVSQWAYRKDDLVVYNIA